MLGIIDRLGEGKEGYGGGGARERRRRREVVKHIFLFLFLSFVAVLSGLVWSGYCIFIMGSASHGW